MTSVDLMGVVAPQQSTGTLVRYDNPVSLLRFPLMVGATWVTEATTVDAMDVRKGGKWRYVSRDTDGTDYGFHGVYKEVVPPERLVSTFEFEGMPGHVVDEIATFEDLGNTTRLTITSKFKSIEDLEGMLASGMESGARETWDRLAELLASL